MAAMELIEPPSTPPSAAVPDRLWTDVDVGRLFGVSAITIRRWVKAGLIPAPVKIRSKRFWAPDVVAGMTKPGA